MFLASLQRCVEIAFAALKRKMFYMLIVPKSKNILYVKANGLIFYIFGDDPAFYDICSMG